jgi:hypothetical protein
MSGTNWDQLGTNFSRSWSRLRSPWLLPFRRFGTNYPLKFPLNIPKGIVFKECWKMGSVGPGVLEAANGADRQRKNTPKQLVPVGPGRGGAR